MNGTIAIVLLLVIPTGAMAGTGTTAAPRISVYGLKSIGTSQVFALSLQEYLESLLIRSEAYEVLSRADIDLILSENRFQQSGACADETCLVQAGSILGVERILTGTLSKVGGTYSLVLKLVNISSGHIEASVSDRYTGAPESMFDIAHHLLFQLLVPAPKQVQVDTLVREVARTRIDTLRYTVRDTVARTDTVLVRDTLYTAPPAALSQKEVETCRPESAALPVPDERILRHNRRIGAGALAILGSLAAGIVLYQMALR